MARGFDAARIAAARHLSAGVRNVTIGAPSLTGFTFEPGADVVIQFPAHAGSADERRYSVWKSNAERGTVDVCIVQHKLGPGSRWAERCEPGDAIAIARSRALPIALDRAAQTHLFFGDETSLAAANALMRALPADAAALAWFEVDGPDRRWPDSELTRPESIHWIDRNGRPGAALLATLADRTFSTEDTAVYITGEAWLCAMTQSHVVRTLGFRPNAVRAMPYWKLRPATT